MKQLERLGLPREQAEALTQHLTTLLCSNKEKVEELFVPKVVLEKVIGSRVGGWCCQLRKSC
jgi:hypothetical protein